MFEESLKFYQDFPTPGIKFVDIIPYLQDRKIFSEVMKEVGRKITAPSVACPSKKKVPAIDIYGVYPELWTFFPE